MLFAGSRQCSEQIMGEQSAHTQQEVRVLKMCVSKDTVHSIVSNFWVVTLRFHPGIKKILSIFFTILRNGFVLGKTFF